MAKKILVADDEEKYRTMHTERLEKAGYSVHTVNSGEEAAAVLASDENLDGVVLDGKMPPGDEGLIVLGSIRQGKYGEVRKQIPVLICSTYLHEFSTADKTGGEFLNKHAM